MIHVILFFILSLSFKTTFASSAYVISNFGKTAMSITAVTLNNATLTLAAGDVLFLDGEPTGGNKTINVAAAKTELPILVMIKNLSAAPDPTANKFSFVGSINPNAVFINFLGNATSFSRPCIFDSQLYTLCTEPFASGQTINYALEIARPASSIGSFIIKGTKAASVSLPS